jgi:hypothetical protein
MKIHTGVKTFACNFEDCKYACYRPDTLAVHVLRHGTEKKFKCEECAYACHTTSDLAKHIPIHTNAEKKFKCKECGFSCHQSTHLTRHILIHTEERPHKCTECNDSFNRSESLTSHIYYYHTEEGQLKRKRQEVIIEKLLKENKIDHKREHRVTFTCLGQTYASIDFLIIINGVVIYLEVDEHQHERYGIGCDVKRMYDVYASLIL